MWFVASSGCTGALYREGPVTASPEDAGARADTAVELTDSEVTTSRDGAVPDAGYDAAAGALVPVFVGQGDLGRSIMSCDDGETWIHDRSLDDAGRCYENGLDCSHHLGTPTGLTYADGRFFVSWGWGTPGSLQRTQAETVWGWETLQREPWLGRALAGNGVLLLVGPVVRRSTDYGGTFSPEQPIGLRRDHVREAAFVPTAGGMFVLVADGGGEAGGPPQDVMLSSDGQVWRHPDSLPSDCGRHIIARGGVAGTASTVVILGGDGMACASNDGGSTWHTTQASPAISPEDTSAPVADGGRIHFWVASGERYSSPDGTSWNSQQVIPNNMHLGPVARHPDSGTYIGISDGSQYSEQRVFRSSDGVSWQPLGADAFPGGHAIHAAETGWVDASVCRNSEEG